ncbi:MAG: magnesium/cobalt transporter CorA [Chthoniobacterales bacterium]
MFKVEYHLPGTPPATLLPRASVTNAPPIITLIQYDTETFLETRIDNLEELNEKHDPSKINWINIDGLSDVNILRQVGDHFGLHPLALEDVLNTTQRPKIELYDGYFFIITEMLYLDKDGCLIVEQVSMFLGKDYILTIQEEAGHDIFERVRDRLRHGKGFGRKMKADYLAYTLMDAAVDQFFPILESLGDNIEELESQMLEHADRHSLKNLYEVKRLLLQLRRASWPQREIFNNLIRDDSGLISKETQVFLRDCYDHTLQIIDMIESYRDLTAGLMDVYLSSVGLRTNEIMRMLTVISSIFIPLTFVAGVYGMNFDTASPFNMPELKWRFGYPLCLLLMFGIAFGQILFFRRKKWL